MTDPVNKTMNDLSLSLKSNGDIISDPKKLMDYVLQNPNQNVVVQVRGQDMTFTPNDLFKMAIADSDKFLDWGWRSERKFVQEALNRNGLSHTDLPVEFQQYMVSEMGFKTPAQASPVIPDNYRSQAGDGQINGSYEKSFYIAGEDGQIRRVELEMANAKGGIKPVISVGDPVSDYRGELSSVENVNRFIGLSAARLLNEYNNSSSILQPAELVDRQEALNNMYQKLGMTDKIVAVQEGVIAEADVAPPGPNEVQPTVNQMQDRSAQPQAGAVTTTIKGNQALLNIVAGEEFDALRNQLVATLSQQGGASQNTGVDVQALANWALAAAAADDLGANSYADMSKIKTNGMTLELDLQEVTDVANEMNSLSVDGLLTQNDFSKIIQNQQSARVR